MSNKQKTPFAIFAEAVGLYFSNISKFTKYMTFPVLGQVIGLVLIFLLTYFYAKNMPMLMEKYSTLNSLPITLGTIILLTLPGMIIFLKAFWEYLVAYGAINSMVENLLKSGKVYDFDAHTELIKRRTVPFVGVWLLFGIFSIIAICPLMWLICGGLAVLFVLIFQVFTYEPEASPAECFVRSFNLVCKHFASTLLLLAMVGALTYVLIPHIVDFLFNYIHLSNVLSLAVVPFVELFPINEMNMNLASLNIPAIKASDIALSIVSMLIAQVVVQYTLPLRSILWALWYKQINGGKFGNYNNEVKTSKTRKKSAKRPSEKLMEESHKKYASKKIDRNILKRAMEKDDND